MLLEDLIRLLPCAGLTGRGGAGLKQCTAYSAPHSARTVLPLQGWRRRPGAPPCRPRRQRRPARRPPGRSRRQWRRRRGLAGRPVACPRRPQGLEASLRPRQVRPPLLPALRCAAPSCCRTQLCKGQHRELHTSTTISCVGPACGNAEPRAARFDMQAVFGFIPLSSAPLQPAIRLLICQLPTHALPAHLAAALQAWALRTASGCPLRRLGRLAWGWGCRRRRPALVSGRALLCCALCAVLCILCCAALCVLCFANVLPALRRPCPGNPGVDLAGCRTCPLSFQTGLLCCPCCPSRLCLTANPAALAPPLSAQGCRRRRRPALAVVSSQTSQLLFLLSVQTFSLLHHKSLSPRVPHSAPQSIASRSARRRLPLMPLSWALAPAQPCPCSAQGEVSLMLDR